MGEIVEQCYPERAVPPSLAELLPSLLAIAVLALLMVLAMVQWTAAMLIPPPSRENGAIQPGTGPAVLWGLLYLLTWGALIGAFLWFLRLLGSRDTSHDLLLLLAMAAGWLVLNRLFIALVLTGTKPRRAPPRRRSRLGPGR
jgi:hypothetical protein